jgi:hypothetical protein
LADAHEECFICVHLRPSVVTVLSALARPAASAAFGDGWLEIIEDDE